MIIEAGGTFRERERLSFICGLQYCCKILLHSISHTRKGNTYQENLHIENLIKIKITLHNDIIQSYNYSNIINIIYF
jgi:hypothetical protein